MAGLAEEKLTNIEVKKTFNNLSEFKSEKEMCDYIEYNIEVFCECIFNDEYVSHERESYLSDTRKRLVGRYGNKTKIDFFIKCKNGSYLLECKNPKNTQRELNRCIAQMLDYILICEMYGTSFNEAYICSTKMTDEMPLIINRFKLPINLCIFSKKNQATWSYKNGI